MERRLAVADIHGCADELTRVLKQARYNPCRDRLFLLGDYGDRGPQPKKAFELARSLQANGAVALLGNHDHAALHSVANREALHTWTLPQNGGQDTLRDFNGVLPDWLLCWLDERPLWWVEPDCILVHAGLRPGVPLAQQTTEDLLWIRGEFHANYTGTMVIFGHTPTRKLHGKFTPWYGTDKIGIDTGSCFRHAHGGCLTLFDLDTHETWTA